VDVSLKTYTVRILYIGFLFFLVSCLFLAYSILSKKPSIHGYGACVSFDPRREGGHLKPNLNGMFRGERLNKPIHFQTNSMGFRNSKEFSYQAPDSTLRILFLGDSHFDGYQIDQSLTMGFLLEQKLSTNKILSQRYKHIEVMISGHNNPTNAWYYFQEHGFRFKPNIVIQGITLGNDITWHNLNATFIPDTNHSQAFLKLTKPMYIWEENPPSLASKYYKWYFPADAYTPVHYWKDLSRRIEFSARLRLSRLSYYTSYLIPCAFSQSEFVSNPRSVSGTEWHMSLALFYKPYLNMVDSMYRDFSTTIYGLQNRVLQDSAQFLTILVPTRPQVAQKEWELICKTYSLDINQFDMNLPNQRISTILRERNIPLVDLTTGLREILNRGEKVFMPLGDMHMNTKGQILAANMLYQQILTMINPPQ